MYAITKQNENLSPHVMRYGAWWIYDLRSFHDFWKQIISERKNIAHDTYAWGALLKAYKIHLFSPLKELIPLANDFFEFYPLFKNKNRKTRKNILETIQIFQNLGFYKIEQLKKFSRFEFQSRLGPEWAIFFEGIFRPDSTPWIWAPHKQPETLHWSHDFDDFCCDAGMIYQEIERGLQNIAQNSPHFILKYCEISFLLSQDNETLNDENKVELSFTYEPSLKKDLAWILQLIKENIFKLSLPQPVWKIFLNISPAQPKKAHQLSLFETKENLISFEELSQKLADLNIQAFCPQSTFSYLPEEAWVRSQIFKNFEPLHSHGLFRPLIQTKPKPLLAPAGALQFTERLTWFDKAGTRHSRDYFIVRGERMWIWAFRNEKKEWFQQGIIE